MLRYMRILMLTIAGLLIAGLAFAAGPTADGHFQRAMEAEQVGKYNEALELLELAYRAEPQPRFIHRRILVLEKMGELQLALDVLDDYRDQLAGAPDVENVAVLEQRLRQQLAQSEDHTTSEADVFGWSLVGGGTALVAGGIASLVYAEGEAERLRCSNQSNADKSGCAGVDAYSQLSAEQFDQKRTGVTTYRVVGAGLSAVGISALGWGIYRLAGAEAPARATSQVTSPELRATFDANGGMGVELELRF
ncbi:hypothetical protein FIV42_03660 [Persicimonas caeni]|uniref:Tetratricopeptide repeat protein n=1 Tax=Persicimonas caeni TaxID=2292766 RepID=A0A4Y6PPD8_PERCE|nr:hypothetical protein [Persicimonas caeni]QDG49867.1 hypothetical protein FIV42_03660 [Persicimonas caeni]QED31088.1 hypothetical protein FRD00_03655 [Persicimonas caeni]